MERSYKMLTQIDHPDFGTVRIVEIEEEPRRWFGRPVSGPTRTVYVAQDGDGAPLGVASDSPLLTAAGVADLAWHARQWRRRGLD